MFFLFNYKNLIFWALHTFLNSIFDYTNFDLKWLTELFVPYHIIEKLQHIEPLKEKVIKELKDNYETKLAEFYTKNLIK